MSVQALPRITIVTPCLNQGIFLEDAVLSVLNQNYPNLEYRVMDGGSRDETLSILRKYEGSLDRWVSEKDRGQSHAINKGFIGATGEIFGWLNADDRLEPGALFTIAEKISRERPWITGACRIQRPRGGERIRRPAGVYGMDRILPWFKNWFPQPSTFWTRELWQKAGPLNEELDYVMDYDLWLRMSRCADLTAVPEVLSSCLWHAGSKSYVRRTLVYAEMAEVMGRYSRRTGLIRRTAYSLGMAAKWAWDLAAAPFSGIKVR